MREILFRAKRLDGREWVEGYYLCNESNGDHKIYAQSPTRPNGIAVWLIDPSTLCQFTGLRDKNGERIWEGDILEYTRDLESGYGLTKFEVFWAHDSFMIKGGTISSGDGLWTYNEYCTRLSSIHDKEQ